MIPLPPPPIPTTPFSSSTKPKPNLPCIVNNLLHLSSKGQLSQALSLLPLLTRKGIRLPTTTLSFLLQRCANARSLELGKWVHLHLKVTGLKRPNVYLSNNLIFMYMNCGDYVSARKVFDDMSVRNLFSWNNMISGCVKLGMIKPARRLFDRMEERDVVSWNTMVVGYAKSGFFDESLKLYREFRLSGIRCNEYSFSGLLTVCVRVKDLRLTKQSHGQVLVSGFLSNVVVSSAVVDAYAKCEEMQDAMRVFEEMEIKDITSWTTMVSGFARSGEVEISREFFDSMPEKNPVSWTSLISGYARHGFGLKALALFSKMIMARVRPDQFTFSSCFCACASISSLKHGKQIHGYLIRKCFRLNTIVVSSLIDMYSKCGSLRLGRLVCDMMGEKHNVVLWNTMISTLAHHGYGEEAIKMFHEMIKFPVKPDRITLVVILNACSHSGLVEEGLMIFESMSRDHGIVLDEEHYACLIELLGRAGHFDKLMKQLEEMPCEPNDLILNALVGVCATHGNVGRETAEQLIQSESKSTAAYALLSSIYATAGNWKYVEMLKQLVNMNHASNDQAISRIEIENEMHTFTMSDSSQPLNDAIYTVSKELTGHIQEVSTSNFEE